MDCLPFYYLMILSIFFVASFDGSTAAGCSGRLRLRASDVAKAEAQIDLSQLSEKQLQQLVQQLAALQSKQEEESLEDQDFEDLQQDEDDHRGSSRPWNKIQRIIRRQLVRIPKRYLKKLLRQFGLARNIGGSNVRAVDLAPRADEYYLIPLE
ncbi:uncharacterized protein LOC108152210 [Drosophila miranda]|uniref:uncharacterized protein LOC108152210 n=1 Tax=Drosophila miranda TaxID=7229 RepID=UPI0007E7F8D4|nr:uncharacterized protein LOC108152210 [Drosophila miranda]